MGPDDLVFVTGGSSAIGLALARRLLRLPAGPCLLAHYHENLGGITALQQEWPDRVKAVQANLADPAEVAGLVARVRDSAKPVTHFVHMAAPALRYQRFSQCDLDRFQHDLQVQLGSVVSLLRFLLPQLAKRPTGPGKVVLLLSSVCVGVPPKYMALYASIKFAQWGLMRALVAEYGDGNLRFNAVSPSMVETPFLQHIPAKAVELSAARNPAGRNASAEEVAATIEYLLSSAADYLNGVNIPITGGSSF